MSFFIFLNLTTVVFFLFFPRFQGYVRRLTGERSLTEEDKLYGLMFREGTGCRSARHRPEVDAFNINCIQIYDCRLN